MYYFCVLSFTIVPGKRLKNLELYSPGSYPQKFCHSRASREAIFLYWVYSLAVEVRQRWRSPLKVNLVLSRKDMCLLQIWKTKQNKTKQKKTKKETVKRFSLHKKKTKQQQKPEYCRFIAVSWFRCFYDDRYSGGGVVEKSNSDSVQKKTAHTIIPPLDALGPSAETEKQFLKQKKKLVGWFDSRLVDILTWLSVAAGLPVSSSRLLGTW